MHSIEGNVQVVNGDLNARVGDEERKGVNER